MRLVPCARLCAQRIPTMLASLLATSPMRPRGNLNANQELILSPGLRKCDQSQLVLLPAVRLASVRAMLTLRHDVVVVPRRDSA